MRNLLSFAQRLFLLREGESGHVLFFGTFLAVAIGTIVLLGCLNDAIFLGSYDAMLLPYVFIAASAAMVFSSAFYGFLAQREEPLQLRRRAFGLFLLALAICYLVSFLQLRWFAFIQYVVIWVIIGLTASLAWQSVLAAFDPRQQKRLAPLVSALATFGAMTGAITARFVSEAATVSALLPICACLYGVLIFLTLKGQRNDSPREPKARHTKTSSASRGGGLSLIVRNRMLSWTTTILVLSVFSSTLVDYVFKSALKLQFTQDEIGAFLGTFYFWFNSALLILQLFVVSRLMGRFGLGGALMSRPAAVMITSGLAILHPVLAAFAALRFLDKLASQSWYKAGVRQTFAPFPAHQASQVILAHDGFVEPISCVMASLLLIGMTHWMGAEAVTWSSLSLFAWIPFVLSIAWFGAGFVVKHRYREQLARSIDTRVFNVPTGFDISQGADYTLLERLSSGLDTQDANLALFLLRVIREAGSADLLSQVVAALEHREPKVQEAAMETLVELDATQAATILRDRLLNEVRPRTIADLLYWLEQAGDSDSVPIAEALLQREAPEVRAEACVILFRLGGPEGTLRADDELKRLMNGPVEARCAAARVIARLGSMEVRDLLLTLLADQDVRVKRAALEAAAHVQSEKIILEVMEAIGEDNTRQEAERALAACVSLAKPIVRDLLKQGPPPKSLVPSLARYLSRAGDPNLTETLGAWLQSDSTHVRYHAIKALVRTKEAGALPSTLPLDRFLRRELKCAHILNVMTTDLDDLRRELECRFAQSMVRIFSALSLRHGTAEMCNARTALGSRDSRAKATAVEFMDTAFRDPVERTFIDLIDSADAWAAYARARRQLALPDGEVLSLERLFPDDPWLRALRGAECTDGLDRERVRVAQGLATSPLFRGLTFEMLYAITDHGNVNRYTPEEWVFQEGDHANSYYVVLNGELDVFVRGRHVSTMTPGSGFGETGMLADCVRTASIKCRAESECFVLPRQSFERLVVASDDFARAVSGYLVAMIRQATEREAALRKSRGGKAYV